MRHSSLCTPEDHRLSRRQWLGGVAGAAGAAGSGGLGFGDFLQPAIADELKSQQKQVLFIWLDGGISQLESWDPKPGTQFGGPFRAIDTSVPGLQICELLPKTAKQMHHLALVRSLCTKDNSHSAGVPRILRGDPKNRGVTYPYFGSAIAKLIGPGPSGLPPYVWIKPGNGGFITDHAGFLGSKYGALAFGDGKPPENLLRHASVSAEEDDDRNALREKIDRRYVAQRARQATEANGFVYATAETLMKRQDLFDASKFSPRDVERYGTHEFGRHLLQARKMLEAGVTFVNVTSYGWDTHGDNFNGHLNLVPKVDQSFAAVVEDLVDSGMINNVLVVLMSEFGRTPRINGHIGRDHWPEAWSLVMGGCGIKRGVVIGKTNAEGTYVDTKEYDIGHMFHTWFKTLGVDPILNEYENHGQPLPIAHDECSTVDELLA